MTPPELRSKVDDPSQIYEILASSRRRHVLAVLQEATEPLPLRDLAREVVAREQEVPPAETDHERTHKCHITLYHAHVPKLHDFGLVEFDSDRQSVALVE